MSVLVCGEALIDLIKQPNATWRAYCGGGAFNTAKAMKALQADVEFLARVSTDTFGQLIRTDLISSGLSEDSIVTTDEPTSLAVVEITEDGTPKYSFYLENTTNFNWTENEIPKALKHYSAVHVGTLALVIEPGRSVLMKFIDALAGDTTIMIDLNVRPAVLSQKDRYEALLEPWLKMADIVKASDEDLKFLYPEMSSQEASKFILDRYSVSLLAITHGSSGASLYTRHQNTTLSAPKVEVVDTVGAGDTFGAALLIQLEEIQKVDRKLIPTLSHAELKKVLDFCITVAALSCTKAGAQPPTLLEVKRFNEQS